MLFLRGDLLVFKKGWANNKKTWLFDVTRHTYAMMVSECFSWLPVIMWRWQKALAESSLCAVGDISTKKICVWESLSGREGKSVCCWGRKKHFGHKGWWPQVGPKPSAEARVGNWRQRVIICRMNLQWVCSRRGLLTHALLREGLLSHSLLSASSCWVLQQFHYMGLCLHLFSFPLPLSLWSLAISQKQNTENCTIITWPSYLFPVGCLLKDWLKKIPKGKKWLFCHTVTSEMFGELCVHHSTRSMKRRWCHFVSKGGFRLCLTLNGLWAFTKANVL